MISSKVSIVVPVYNLENYIENSVRSLLVQTYQNIEIVLVDDGSKDASLSIIERLATLDARIVYATQPNGGAAKARNLGLSMATGEFITFVDGDDMLSPNAISDNMDYFMDDKVDWVAFSIRRVDADGKYFESKVDYSDFIISESEEISSESFVPYFYSRKLSGVACAAIYRRSSVESISFVNGKYYEDSIYFTAITSRTQYAVLSAKGEYLYVERTNSSQKAELDYKHLQSLCDVVDDRLCSYRKYYPMYESFYSKEEELHYYFLRYEAIKGNDAARKMLNQAKVLVKRNFVKEVRCLIYSILGYHRVQKMLEAFNH